MFEEKRENPEIVTHLPAEPEEVVSWYTPKSREGQEVVSYYVQPQPLPEKAKRQPEKKKKSRRGLWIFLSCFALLLVLVGVGVAISLSDGSRKPGDGEELPNDGGASSIIHLGGDVQTSIPTIKGEEGLRLNIENTHGEKLTIQQVYAQVNPSVITVVAA